MANTIQIKRSATTATPATLADGELAYSSLSDNLFIGEAGNVITKIGGGADVVKLAGIEAGAQVNTVLSVAGQTGNVTLTKSDVGLSNVDNTSDANKPVSTATQTELNLKANIASPTFTGTVSGVTATMVGLGNVTNESKATMFSSPTFTGTVSGVTATHVGLGNVTNESKATMFTSPTFSGDVTLGNSTPSQALHAASKAYVDGMSLGISVKDPVQAATTAPITLSGLQTIDGVGIIAGDRVLVKNQADATTNGIYVAVDGGAWTRATDFDNSPSGEVRNGSFVYVESGSVNAYVQYVLAVEGTVVIGTTDLVFVQFGSVASYNAGTGLTLTGTTFAIDSSVVTESGGVLEALSGANLTSLNGSNISSGTVADARLSGNVLLNSSTIDGGTY